MKIRKRVSWSLTVILVSLIPVVQASGQTENWTTRFVSAPGDTLFGPVWQEQLQGIFDFDGDGYGEFITLLANPEGGNNAKLVWVEAQADNFYTAQLTYSWTGLYSTQRSLAVGDLDGDGIDEIVACVETIDGVHGMVIFEFDPITGTFPSTPTVTWDPRAAGYIGCSAINNRWAWEVTPIIDDIDGDGKNELISPTVCGTAIFELTTQDYSNPIWEAEYYDITTFIQPWSFAIGDLDGDGRKELYDGSAWPDFSKPTVFNVLEATGEDTYELIVTIPADLMPSAWAGTNGYTVVADLDSDGNQEFYQTDIFGNFWVFAPGGDLSSVDSSDFYLLNTFESYGWDIGDMLLGDQDGDGKPNFYIAGHHKITDIAYKSGGSATDPLSYTANTVFEDDVPYAPLYPFRLAVGNDLDGDGKKEVVFISVNHGPARSTVYVLEWTEAVVSNIALNLHQINAYPGDTVLVDVSVQFPADFTCNSADINIGGYMGLLDFIEVITDSSLMGTAGWTIQINETDSLQITASAGAEDISGEGVLFRFKFTVPDTASGFIPITLESAIFNTGDVPVELTSGGVDVFTLGPALEQIKNNLLNNPPNTGDPTVREQTILALDNILKDDSSRSSQSVYNFYNLMMEKVNTELRDTVPEGAAIWMMYNHGFVIKTPQHVFAFDLVDGYHGWLTHLPSELIQQIEVLFISHEHGDHFDNSVASAVMANGGYVVVPSENSNMGNVPMAEGDSLTISGLHIKAHYGLHSVPIRIYEVTTPSGFKILHTGDNQTSATLPEVDSVDVLLLNAWVNDSGTGTAVVGMRNCINKLNPTVMIPGHIHELGHDYVPGNPTSRVPYEWAFEVDDEPITAEVRVMAWGERYFVAEEIVGISKHDEDLSLPKSFVLHQNHPNPFNPTTTVRYDLPKAARVILRIYNLGGQEVKTLVDEVQSAGEKLVTWDARNRLDQMVSSGVYIYSLQVDNERQTRKMLLVR
ncbi:MAG: FlgD immunoglobulin-like domain containing protein [bacterium]